MLGDFLFDRSEVVKDYWLKQGTISKVHVVGEIEIPVNHCLLTRHDTNDIKEVRAVMSHSQALAQCAGNLDKEEIYQRIPIASTAGAAEKISVDPTIKNTAAIASSFAGQLYKLNVLHDHFEDSPGNATRFHIVYKAIYGGPESICVPTDKDRTAIVFRLPNKPGALVNVISCIADEGVNMSSIHSIPLGVSGTYAFYCEFDVHASTNAGVHIIIKLRLKTEELLVLGSYPRQTSQGE